METLHVLPSWRGVIRIVHERRLQHGGESKEGEEGGSQEKGCKEDCKEEEVVLGLTAF
ncbi:MAG TPA: hypothetical protein VHE37_15270 [Nevskiaceae bacterium]|nr:hypothetical protein [Nevskiaceae bacterium]